MIEEVSDIGAYDIKPIFHLLSHADRERHIQKHTIHTKSYCEYCNNFRQFVKSK